MAEARVTVRSRFALVLESPAEDRERSLRRLRAALKCLLRMFRLRCLSAKEDR